MPVAISQEVDTEWSNSQKLTHLAESSKEGYGSKRDLLPLMMMGEIILMFFQNVSQLLPDYRVSRPRRQYSSELSKVFKMHTQAAVVAKMAHYNRHTGELICICDTS
jgi:hypothetical protein